MWREHQAQNPRSVLQLETLVAHHLCLERSKRNRIFVAGMSRLPHHVDCSVRLLCLPWPALPLNVIKWMK